MYSHTGKNLRQTTKYCSEYATIRIYAADGGDVNWCNFMDPRLQYKWVEALQLYQSEMSKID